MAAKAEEAEPEPAAEKSPKPRRKLPLKFVVAAAGAALVVGGGGAGFLVLRGKPPEHEAALPAKPVAFFDVPDLLVNLSTSSTERTQYLKAKVVLELPDPALTTQVQSVMPRVMDVFQTYLRELRPSDLEGSAGVYRLREELTRRVNAAIAPGRVNAVLFKEIVVQ
jgi:flagellar FliL protein